MDQDTAAKLHGIEIALQELLRAVCNYGGAGLKIANIAKDEAMRRAQATDESVSFGPAKVVNEVGAIFSTVQSNRLGGS